MATPVVTAMERFDQITLVYKTMKGVPFEVAVLVPKSIQSEKTSCPLLVHFHGGALIIGTTLEPAFLAPW